MIERKMLAVPVQLHDRIKKWVGKNPDKYGREMSIEHATILLLEQSLEKETK